MDYAAIGQTALSQIAKADELDTLEALRVEFLGKQGSISGLLKTLGGMSPDERQSEGPKIHQLREDVTSALAARKAALETAALDLRLASERIDLSLPAPEAPRGTIHPVSQVMDELAEIFADLGFAVATGPEIEDGWHNFTALNMPESHPARAMHDTFYFPDLNTAGEEMLLRTHTSPVQIRTMLAHGAPLRIIAPGRVYRSDSDATHTPMFHQVEGLVIDKGIHLGHLKWTLETILKAFFERDDIVLRLRPSYSPSPNLRLRSIRLFLVDGRRVVGGSGDDPAIAGWNCSAREWSTGCARVRRARSRRVAGLCLRRRRRPARHVQIRDGRSARLLRWRCPLAQHYGFSPLDVPTLSGGVGAGA